MKSTRRGAKSAQTWDSLFYKAADDFFISCEGLALTYDDVSLATLYSEILPREANYDTLLAPGLHLHLPVVSADMDTVTESRMAISLALHGGLGLIHYNMPPKQQLSEVSRVKNHVHGLIREPIKVHPDQKIGDVLSLIEENKVRTHLTSPQAKQANATYCLNMPHRYIVVRIL
jgi:IMP dehydrogenase